jgi:hypothetical protein
MPRWHPYQFHERAGPVSDTGGAPFCYVLLSSRAASPDSMVKMAS